MKNILSILGAVCFMLGFAMATGVDQNPIQAIYALILMGAASFIFAKTDRKKSAKSNNRTTQKVYDYHTGTFCDVA